ncbi:MAG TPA: exosortase K [Pyrinomonadaceae bacterium]|nr:exosortase K [Pyrinomonadaceae bacterium]
MNSRRRILQLLTTLAAAYGLKYFYSNSSVNDLRWILAPTTFFVELFTGMQFRFESNAGYLSDDRSFLIAQPCSGMNFMIIAFVMLAVGKLWRDRNLNWIYLPIALVMSYVATIVANTVRIVVALELRKYDLGYDYDEVHLVEGIVVYFGFLLLLFVVSEKLGSHSYRRDRAIPLRRIAIPLLIYYGVTLGIPLARGAFNETEFWKHALVVLITPLVLIVPIVLMSLVKMKDEADGNVNEWL